MCPFPNQDRMNEFLIRAHAIGVGMPDILIRAGTYNFMPPLPAVPGQELSGTIERVGANARTLTERDVSHRGEPLGLREAPQAVRFLRHHARRPPPARWTKTDVRESCRKGSETPLQQRQCTARLLMTGVTSISACCMDGCPVEVYDTAMSHEHSHIQRLKHRWDQEDAERDELEEQARLKFLEQEANQIFSPIENYLTKLDEVLRTAGASVEVDARWEHLGDQKLRRIAKVSSSEPARQLPLDFIIHGASIFYGDKQYLVDQCWLPKSQCL
jgi:Alcohol dehydrogenase GroES-like domain